jgi:hypothetical protein
MGVADAMGPMSKGKEYDLGEKSTLLTFFVFIALPSSACRADCWRRESAKRNCCCRQDQRHLGADSCLYLPQIRLLDTFSCQGWNDVLQVSETHHGDVS